MPLQGDQRALLQLLCERGQSYEDISGLLDVPADAVHERARAALTEIAGSDPDADVGLTDYLLGQADPIGRADAVRHLQADPEALALAVRIQEGLREIAPEAKQPKLPEARGGRRRAALPDQADGPATPPDLADSGDRQGSSRQTRLIAGLACLGLILIVAILAIAGVFSGGEESTTASSATTAAATTTADPSSPTTADPANTTTVTLKPVDGSGVAGTAEIGLVPDQAPYVDVDIQGLDPSAESANSGESYLIWLMVADTAGFPIDRLEADENGSFTGRLVVPSAIAYQVGTQARSIMVSSTSVSALQSEIKQAVKQKVPILPFIGTPLASGALPLVKTSDQKGQSKQKNQSGQK